MYFKSGMAHLLRTKLTGLFFQPKSALPLFKFLHLYSVLAIFNIKLMLILFDEMDI